MALIVKCWFVFLRNLLCFRNGVQGLPDDSPPFPDKGNSTFLFSVFAVTQLTSGAGWRDGGLAFWAHCPAFYISLLLGQEPSLLSACTS